MKQFMKRKKTQRLTKLKFAHANICLVRKKNLAIPCGSHWRPRPAEREDSIDHQKFTNLVYPPIRPISDHVSYGT